MPTASHSPATLIAPHDGTGAPIEEKEIVADLAAEIARLRATNAKLVEALDKIKDGDGTPAYHHQGMGCGVEDRCLQTDGYGAAEYGWDCATERFAEWAAGIAEDALDAANEG